MSTIPEDLKYTEDHEWVRDNGDGTYTVGVTDHAQQALGDLVYVELPELESFAAGDNCAVVESVKAASDVYSPLTGEVIGVNEELEDEPELINNDPYDAAWIFTMRATVENPLDDLMDAEAYQAHCENEE